MSHTRELTMPGGTVARMHYNSDWSGEVEVVWPEPDGARGRVTLPGWLVQAIREDAAEGEIGHQWEDATAPLGDAYEQICARCDLRRRRKRPEDGDGPGWEYLVAGRS